MKSGDVRSYGKAFKTYKHMNLGCYLS